jgi:hypothetical protein
VTLTRTGLWAVALLPLAAGCMGGASLRRLEPPVGAEAFGVTFGAPRARVEQQLAAAGARPRPDPTDADALVAERCRGLPAEGPCVFHFSPAGLYAAEQQVPLAEAGALLQAVVSGLGPARAAAPGSASDGSWEPVGWSVAVTRHPEWKPPAATVRAEFDAAAPPVVGGVPLGRLRGDVEAHLDTQGALRIQRDAEATSYLGCPNGDPDAISCTITFRRGRAAAVTEVFPSPADDGEAMAAWQARSAAVERDIGRVPVVSCPATGPDRVEGDCTATWSTSRLVVVVGAHRNQGGQHRGPISVYLGYGYPLLPEGDGD